MNLLKSTTALAQAMCLQYADPGAVAVDGTCGRGKDTLWLSEHFRKVYAFDIQKDAIESTRELLGKAGRSNVVLIRDSHEKIKAYVGENPRVIVFNLGYLPGGEKKITTRLSSTLPALQASLDILAVNGLISITMYQGHQEGYDERKEILRWAAALDSAVWHCVHTNMLNQTARPSEILWITKKK